ncbi:WD40 repeat domain-containing serine/threonine-protein kinase [Actinomadura oligospora]|uniref:WD40 repeat domain-containing serine/threonine-protein kinase n=1 Tax=Actinomadura oligospora TaxID=111804 RepID=UPI0004BA8DFA|nr:WD40 repeat domain-containing serine/threonine-protein kinase [Actinomadura oligospora]
MAEPLHPGDPRQLGSFYLDGRLGAGGQGVVYEGYGPGGERVAVKALHGVLDRDRETLRKETWAWRKVAAYCTAKVLYADLDGPIPFVVSEHVAGPNLRQAVTRGGPYGPDELRRLAIGLATALVGVHRARVVHRDLKPENILLAPDGPRLIDFGIARIEEQPTTTGLLKGTLRYMPPERYRGEHGDAKVDVWGWGAVVLFAATGRHAFTGDTAPVIARRVETHHPDTSMLDEPLRALVTASLAKDPADRPDAEDLLLGLVGAIDLKEATRRAVPDDRPPEPPEPSRAELAEVVFTGLGVREQEAVPQLLLRLVAPGERAEDTLRSARRDEFADGQVDDQVVDRVLRDFTGAGVLVWTDDTVTLSSAALIRAWPRLREWADGERAGLGVHQDLVDASRLWHGHGRKRSDLYQGTALERAQSWAATGRRHLTLSLVERGFLDAAAALSLRRGRLRALVSIGLSVLLVIAIGAAAVAIDQRRTVVGQRDRAASAQVAGLAQSLRRTRPDLARRLAVAAGSIADTPESWSALFALRNQVERRSVRLPDFDAIWSDLDGSGRLLAAAGGNQAGVWDADSGRKVGSFRTAAGVGGVDLSDDGKTLAVRVLDGTIAILSVPGLSVRNVIRYKDQGLVNAAELQLSPAGTYLAASETGAYRNGITVWDTRTGRQAFHDPRITGFVSFSPQETVLSIKSLKTVTWTDLRTRRKLPTPDFHIGNEPSFQAVRFSPDGRTAALPGRDGVRLVSIDTNTVQEVKGPEDVTRADQTFSHSGEFMATQLNLWRISPDDGVVMRYPTTMDECAPGTFRFTARDTELRCTSGDGVLFSLDITRYTRQPESRSSEYNQATSSRDGSTMAVLRDDEAVEIWSTSPLAKRFELPKEQFSTGSGLKLSPNGRMLAVKTGMGDGKIDIWDLSKRTRIGSLPGAVTQYSDPVVENVDFAPDGRTLVRNRPDDAGRSLSFWNLSPMRQIREMRGEPWGWGAVAFRPDGGAVLSGHTLVEFPSGKVLRRGSTGLTAGRFSTDGKMIFDGPSELRGSVSFYDPSTLARTGYVLRTGDLTPTGRASLPAHDARDRVLAVAYGESDSDGEIKLWDLRTRTPLGIPLTGHRRTVLAMAFTPDGQSLVSVDSTGGFRTHSVAPKRLEAELCATSGALTKSEWKTNIPDAPYRKTC